MKSQMNTLLKSILAATFLISAGTTFAQGNELDSGKPGQRGPRGMQGAPIVEQLMRAIRGLDLSDEQKTDIQAVMQQMKTEVTPTMEEMKDGQLQLRELIKADEYDEDAVAGLAAKEGDLAAERMIITSRALAEVYGYLTEEQRAELEVMATQRMKRRSGKRKSRAG